MHCKNQYADIYFYLIRELAEIANVLYRII